MEAYLIISKHRSQRRSIYKQTLNSAFHRHSNKTGVQSRSGARIVGLKNTSATWSLWNPLCQECAAKRYHKEEKVNRKNEEKKNIYILYY